MTQEVPFIDMRLGMPRLTWMTYSEAASFPDPIFLKLKTFTSPRKIQVYYYVRGR